MSKAKDFVVTWDSYFGDAPDADLRLKRMYKLAIKQGVALPRKVEVDAEVEGVPRISQNVWHVPCPFDGCSGSELAREDELFLCQSCWNYPIGRKHIRAPFPQQRRAIEQALLVRPNPANRNWVPGETVADLHLENEERGV